MKAVTPEEKVKLFAELFAELFALLERHRDLLLDAHQNRETDMAQHASLCQLHNGLIQPPSRRRCTCGRL